MSESSTRKIVYKILKKHNTIWHPESTLVFKSQKDKRVIGRYEDDEIVFDDTVLELCSEWKFKYDESLVEEENGEDNSEEGGEGDTSPPDDNGEEAGEEDEEEQPPVKSKPENLKSKECKKEPGVGKNPLDNAKTLTNSYTNSLFLIISDLQTQLSDTEAQLRDKSIKLDVLQKKFDGIKQLFS